MNDLAREVLVKAQLSGIAQIRHNYHSKEGHCALGVLHLHIHNYIDTIKTIENYNLDTIKACASSSACFVAQERLFDISLKEANEIVRANDILQWDFLTIARKIGSKEEGEHHE